MIVRSLIPRAEVLRVQTRSGKFDDGKPWSVPEAIVIDIDRNKVTLRIDDTCPKLEPGFYDVEIETSVSKSDRGDRVRQVIVGARPVKVGA